MSQLQMNWPLRTKWKTKLQDLKYEAMAEQTQTVNDMTKLGPQDQETQLNSSLS